MDDLTIELRKSEPVALIRLSGEIYLPDVPSVTAALVRGMQATRHGVAVCDVSGLLPPMSDWLLTAFPAALRRCGGWPRASLHLAAPAPDLAAALRRVRMRRYLPVHPTLADAFHLAGTDALADTREIILQPEPEALKEIRDCLRDLWPQRVGGVEDAVLVADELASNAIKHVAEPAMVSLAISSTRALIAVTDPSRAEPFLRPPRWTAVSGRGMQVISRLASAWGVRLVHDGGKTVWAALPSPVGQPAAAIPRSRSLPRD
ncbi:MAG TPA: ATP-binding protein [Kineosporiaceae bacterium]|nr:ATP-binding protein [Kineosporiaceae bacterium]